MTTSEINLAASMMNILATVINIGCAIALIICARRNIATAKAPRLLAQKIDPTLKNSTVVEPFKDIP